MAKSQVKPYGNKRRIKITQNATQTPVGVICVALCYFIRWEHNMEKRIRRKKVKKVFSKDMQAWLLLVFVIVIILFLVLAGRIYYFNVWKGTKYAKKTYSQHTYTSNEIPYKRGDILDRNYTKLATCKTLYNVVISPKDILENKENVEPTIQALELYFGVNREEIETSLETNPTSKYRVVAREVTKAEVEKYEEMIKQQKELCKKSNTTLRIVGISLEKKFKRVYPSKTVACNVVGYSNSENRGLWGLELQYNESLNGVTGRSYAYYNQNSQLERTVKDAVNGDSIVTTIDVNIQSIVEKNIKLFMERLGAKNVAALVMNPNNGEIYAMSSNIQYNLNDPFNLEQVYTKEEVASWTKDEQEKKRNLMWQNYCISTGFEPGSTVKPLTIAVALEEHIASDHTWFVCDGGENVSGVPIRCVSTIGHGDLTLEGSMMKSCNDVMMQLVSKMGKSTFAKYQDIFNLGRKTGIDLPGETTGIVCSEEKLGPTELATSSFGQTMNVNMVQVASAVASVINGGYYYQPHMVKQIIDEQGNVVENIEGIVKRKTVSKETSDLIRKYLLSTVKDGTGSSAQVAGYSIGGKTGTAEKLPRKQGNYLVSFIGAVPMEKPEVLVYVVVDEPNVEDQAHSVYAQEVARDILDEILPFLEIYKDEQLLKEAMEEGVMPTIEPTITPTLEPTALPEATPEV